MDQERKDIKIGVTGGTGLVGSHLLKALVEEGYTHIIALKRPGSEIKFTHQNIQWVEGDLLDIPSLEEAFSTVEVLFHCAGLVSFSSADKQQLIDINIEGTRNLVNVSIDYQVAKFIFLSSVAAIGRPENEDRVIDESTKWEDSKRNSAYGISKRQAELEVWRGQSEGLNTLIFNPATILGSGFWKQGSGALIPSFLQSKLLPPGSNGFVWVQDVVKVLIKAINTDISAERYILSSENKSYASLIRATYEAAGKRPPTRRLSRKWVPLIRRLLPLLRPFISNSSMINKHTLMIASSHSRYDGSKAKSAFQIDYKPIDQVVRSITQNYIEERS